MQRNRYDVHNAYYLRSLLYAEVNELQNASIDIKEALRLQPDPRYFYNAILIERNLGNSTKATELLKSAKRQFPNDERLRQL